MVITYDTLFKIKSNTFGALQNQLLVPVTTTTIAAGIKDIELKSHKAANTTSFFELMPEETNELLPGVKWGHMCQLYTPAFWKYMYHYHRLPENENAHRLSSNILEEVVACLLGGYGIPSELGILAFKRLRDEKLIKTGISLRAINNALSKPFECNGVQRMYRFRRQKAKYICEFLNRDDLKKMPNHDDLEFRSWLLTIKGIGPKTASWVTRNWFKSERVAILDIHVLRAGKIAGFFTDTDNVTKRYFDLENRYINFCTAIDVLPSNMDAIIWSYMKKTNRLAIKFISNL
jgi:N-glycosylase/DNA lyase